MEINLNQCWFDFVENEMDFGDDPDQGDPVVLPPDDLSPAPVGISCKTVHPLLTEFFDRLAEQQILGVQPEQLLDELRVQVATCLATEFSQANLALMGGDSPATTVMLSLGQLAALAYLNVVQAFAAADYVHQHLE
jgi:hypothetical protein